VGLHGLLHLKRRAWQEANNINVITWLSAVSGKRDVDDYAGEKGLLVALGRAVGTVSAPERNVTPISLSSIM
jgi:hypothetical protein